MDVTQAVAALKQKWREFYDSFTRPPRCAHCDSDHVVWNGSRERKLSVLVADRVAFVAELVCRRVRCQACRQSWTLRPPGVSPRRHYQLDVVAQAASRYLFEAGTTEASVAVDHRCDPRTVSRWLHWIPALAEPELLQRLVMDTEGLVVPAVRGVEGLARKAVSLARRILLARAARVLCLLETLGLVRGLEPPGLRGVVEAVVRNRDRITTYAAPGLPVPDLVR